MYLSDVDVSINFIDHDVECTMFELLTPCEPFSLSGARKKVTLYDEWKNDFASQSS